MPFRFHIPLPGPFSYSRRIGGGGRRRARSSGNEGAGTARALDRVAERIEAWGDEGARRDRERRTAAGLPPDAAPKTFREQAFPVPFSEMVAERKRRLGRGK